jgi:hypothetical protein
VKRRLEVYWRWLERSGLRGVAARTGTAFAGAAEAAFARTAITAEIATAMAAAASTTTVTITTAEAAFTAPRRRLELAFAAGLAVFTRGFEVAVPGFADFARGALAAELAAVTVSATTATASTTRRLRRSPRNSRAFAGTALVTGLCRRFRGLAAEEVLHPAEEAAGFLLGGSFGSGCCCARERNSLWGRFSPSGRRPSSKRRPPSRRSP